MDEKNLAADFLVKSTNLCHFLSDEKNEKMISHRLFTACASLCEAVCSLKNNLLAKSEIASVKKCAALECDKITLHLSALFSSGYISSAQQGSMLQSLDNLKKQINIQ